VFGNADATDSKETIVIKKIEYDKFLYQNGFFARPVYNEQLYSLIVWSKVALFSPWAKNHSLFNLLWYYWEHGISGSNLFVI
jgi:hypothetical protein